MLNKNKRRLARFPIMLFIMVMGSYAIQLLTVSVFFNTYVSLNWIKENMNISVDITKASVELGWLTLFTALWLMIVHLAVLWFVSDKLEARMWRRWPDRKLDVIKVRQTKRRAYKRRNA